jgi:hypothetical protein
MMLTSKNVRNRANVTVIKICADFTRRRGFFVQPRRFFAGPWLWFGWVYLAVMLVRSPAQALLASGAPAIPIFRS